MAKENAQKALTVTDSDDNQGRGVNSSQTHKDCVDGGRSGDGPVPVAEAGGGLATS